MHSGFYTLHLRLIWIRQKLFCNNTNNGKLKVCVYLYLEKWVLIYCSLTKILSVHYSNGEAAEFVCMDDDSGVLKYY
jgi:hypothetical protein